MTLTKSNYTKNIKFMAAHLQMVLFHNISCIKSDYNASVGLFFDLSLYIAIQYKKLLHKMVGCVWRPNKMENDT